MLRGSIARIAAFQRPEVLASDYADAAGLTMLAPGWYSRAQLHCRYLKDPEIYREFCYTLQGNDPLVHARIQELVRSMPLDGPGNRIRSFGPLTLRIPDFLIEAEGTADNQTRSLSYIDGTGLLEMELLQENSALEYSGTLMRTYRKAIARIMQESEGWESTGFAELRDDNGDCMGFSLPGQQAWFCYRVVVTETGHTKIITLSRFATPVTDSAAWLAVQKSILEDAEVNDGFSRNEIERYSRQILAIRRSGQLLLRDAHILIAGAGGLATTLIPSLAASGVGRITVYDPDRVEMHNLGRQWMFREEDCGHLKVEVLRDRIRTVNPHISITAVAEPFSGQAVTPDIQLLIDATDSLPCKLSVSDMAVQGVAPAVTGALGRDHGHIMYIKPGGAPCYRCLFPEAAPVTNCAESGIVSTLPGLAGSIMAQISLEVLLSGKAPVLTVISNGASGLRIRQRTPAVRMNCICQGDSAS